MSEKSGSRRPQAVPASEYYKGPKSPSRRRLIIGGGTIAAGLSLTAVGLNVFGGNKDGEPKWPQTRTRDQDDGFRLLRDPNIEHKNYQIIDTPEIRKHGAAERDEVKVKGQGDGLPSNELDRLRVGDKLYGAVRVKGQPVLIQVGQSLDDEWITYFDEKGRVGFVHASNVEPLPPEKPLRKI